MDVFVNVRNGQVRRLCRSSVECSRVFIVVNIVYALTHRNRSGHSSIVDRIQYDHMIAASNKNEAI